MDLKPGRVIAYLDFNRIHSRFPNALYPAFKFQIAMRLTPIN
eukprot:gene13059-27559_t